MSHGPEQHIEHAEHAAHASHDEFNKRVTMSIAMVAAVLACVTMLGHRAHNETLILQGDALRIQGEALQFQTLATRESANAGKQWQYYGTKNLVFLESEIRSSINSMSWPRTKSARTSWRKPSKSTRAMSQSTRRSCRRWKRRDTPSRK